MEEEAAPDARVSPPLRLQTPTLAGYPVPSLSASFKLDEGYSDDTRSLADKDLALDHVMMLPDWVLAQSEADRAEFAYSLLRSLRTSTISTVVERLNPLLHMDPVLKLPPEITSEIFSYLDTRTVLNASLASRSWRSRILDSGLWRLLYINEGWRMDIHAIRNFEQEQSEAMSPQTRKSRPRHSETDLGEPKQKKRVPPTWLDSRSAEGQGTAKVSGHTLADADLEGDHHMTDASDRGAPLGGSPKSAPPTSLPHLPSPLHPPLRSSLFTRPPNGTAKLNWAHLYKQRRRLEANWRHGRFTNFQLPHPAHPEEAHQECVYGIQFSGKWLVSGSRDRTVRVWDLETKRLWHPPLTGHSKSVLCLQFDPSPAEDVIISGSSDRSVIMWRFSTGQKIHQITNAHADSVLNLKFDHRYLVTCSKDRTVKVWNRRELLPTDEDYPRICKGGGATYPSHIVNLSEFAPSALEASLAQGHIKALQPYTLLMIVEGHGAAVNAMQIHGDEIVTASGDRMIKIWNIRTGACLKTLIGHEKGIACVQFDSRRIISGSNDNTVRIYDHVSGAEVACLRGHNNLVRTVQAGFGDPPGADEALRLEALAVENEFWNAQRAGMAVDVGPRALRRAGRHTSIAGSRDPRHLMALGAKIPPGGGGSVWGRIVSGSYDETVVIWHKDRDGGWTPAHKLCQPDAVANAARLHLSQTAQNAVSAQGLTMAAMAGTGQVTQNGEAPPNNADGNNNNDDDDDVPPAAHTTTAAPALQNGGQNQTIAHPHINHPVPQVHGAPPPAPPPHHHHHIHHVPNGHRPLPATPPMSRVFKVQFDSRKIICASQDPRIVGWDFACNDEEIIEACPFFQGL